MTFLRANRHFGLFIIAMATSLAREVAGMNDYAVMQCHSRKQPHFHVLSFYARKINSLVPILNGQVKTIKVIVVDTRHICSFLEKLSNHVQVAFPTTQMEGGDLHSGENDKSEPIIAMGWCCAAISSPWSCRWGRYQPLPRSGGSPLCATLHWPHSALVSIGRHS